MLRFIIPTGSLADAVRTYLRLAGYDVPMPDRRGFCGVVNGVEFWQLDRRTIPKFLATGKYDAGITGRDLLIESGVRNLDEYCALNFSRSSEQPTRWVLAKRADKHFPSHRRVTIGCELPRFAAHILQDKDFGYRIVPISGSEEQCVRDGIVDMILVVTESGSSLTANSLDIVPGCECLFESTPVIVARPTLDDQDRCDLLSLAAALRSTVGAKRRVMVFFDIKNSVDLEALELPCSVAPTVTSLTDDQWRSCTVCIPISEQGRVLVQLESAGARGIVVIAVQGYIA